MLMRKQNDNKPRSKARAVLSKVLSITIFIFSIVMLAVSATLFYQRSYLTAFWVNGQSMYPTLNENATSDKGIPVGVYGGSSNVGYTVDYGVMDCHKSALKKLERFDVISTKYSDDDYSNKIKRIIGLPGETIFFSTETETNGELYVNGEYVEQPLLTKYVRSGKYPTTEIVLNDNEYYVCGDNRGHSSDSRNNGPIHKDWIEGKVIALCGTAEVYRTNEGKFDVKNIKYYWPRFFKWNKFIGIQAIWKRPK